MFRAAAVVEKFLRTDRFDIVFLEMAPEYMKRSVKERGMRVC